MPRPRLQSALLRPAKTQPPATASEGPWPEQDSLARLEHAMTTTDASPLSGLLLRGDGTPVGAEGSPVHALLVTPVEAARRLSVGRTTIYALMASGELSSVTIGRCRRVPVTSLQSFVARLVDNASVDGRQW